MKKSLIAVAVASAFASTAYAADQQPAQQPSVTVYGVIDAAIRHTSNTDLGGGSYLGFSQGLFNGTRFGLKGSEQLDNGMKAIFTLEAGATLGTGSSDQQGQLFGRQAWAGLSDDSYGSLTLGRQYGNFADAIGTGDVFGEKHGNEVYSSTMTTNNTAYPSQGDTVSENGFMYQEMGYRWDNSVLYANKLGPVKFGVMHSFQGQTTAAGGNNNSGNKQTMNSLSVGYVSNTFNATVGYQIERDATGKQHKDVGFGTNYMFTEKSGVFLSYFTSSYDQGFTRIGLGTNSTISGTMAAPRKDKIAELSANVYATDKLNLIAAMWHDSATNLAIAGDSGSRLGELGTADYYMSKNTDTYFAVGHTKLKGMLIGNSNGGNIVTNGLGAGNIANPSSVNTVMVGMRHRF